MRTDGRTNSYDETNSRFMQFCERAQKNTKFLGQPRDYRSLQDSGPWSWIRINAMEEQFSTCGATTNRDVRIVECLLI